MPPSVTLTFVGGPLAGQDLRFEERTTCILGRAPDCQPRLPGGADYRTVSRHHCRLDVNPPGLTVRDLGSRNGTFVDGTMIGQREAGQSAEEGARLVLPEQAVADGQEVRLAAALRLRVRVTAPVTCRGCGVEIPEGEQDAGRGPDGAVRCGPCARREAGAAGPAGPDCASCGRPLSGKEAAAGGGEVVCAACRANPAGLVRSLLEGARSGSGDRGGIEGYRVVRELGRGGMGVVYLARHERTGEEVALKVMLPEGALNPQNRRLFLREVDSTRVLDHPHVVRLRDAGTSRGVCYLTLEYCEQGSVEDLRRRRGGTLPAAEAVPILLQVLEGLQYAHTVPLPAAAPAGGRGKAARGLVHRDLKPHNIFLAERSGRLLAKVGDFGLAKAFDLAGLSGMTVAGMVAGTPAFMPRQQALDFQYSEPAVDVWAAAASLYFLLCGAPPRHFPPGKDPWWVVLETPAVPLRRRAPGVPAGVARVLDLALTDTPDLRMKTAAELHDALRRAL